MTLDVPVPDLRQTKNSVAHLAGNLLLISETAAIFDLSQEQVDQVESAVEGGNGAVQDVLCRFGLDAPANCDLFTSEIEPIRALALTVSQTCNLACGYCYAAGGSFGGADTRMNWTVAKAAIDQLLSSTIPGAGAKIAFMGGEPMVARDIIRRCVDYANQRAAARAIRVGYSLTTNGTLVTEDDAEFFARHGFAITVSLDGGQAVNDRLRPFKAGTGSFARVAERVGPLLKRQAHLSLSARVTVTPDNLDLQSVVTDIAALGFQTVGVSPMINSPTGQGAISGDDFSVFLDVMKVCGEEWMDATIAGRSHPFANLSTVLGELHRGKPRSHGCGAARDYLAIDASGNYSACHRFVNDPLGAMGTLDAGPDVAARARFLNERAVERQQPCQTCWARRLCGGGCHQEVLHAGRPACDFVRGWLDYGLRSYGRLLKARPDWFDDQV